MGWERRRNGWYYYRSWREGGRSVKRYVGCGAAAEAAATKDAARRGESQADLQTARGVTRTYLPLITNLDTMKVAFEAAFRATAAAAGYHQHHHEWRRRR